ncbi:MAG TPA: hypothetical protein VKT52_05210 [Ktedonobacterales bacterium]|nr:hypothetical protein [Ktedonobacterales bacterium]
MSTSSAGAGNLWPAEVIHVNEDGWVLVNRGRAHGVVPGLRLLVVGTGIRELRNVMVASDDQPLALRIRRTYEELDVLYVEETCAVAVATRAPAARRPKFYRGPDGELLVWVPLPEGWTYPHPGTDDTPADDTDDSDDDQDADEQEDQDDADDTDDETPDAPPEVGEQDDERWEEALPLNGVGVGDLVVPAIPAASASATNPTGAATPSTASGDPAAPNPFEAGRDYGWMKQES